MSETTNIWGRVATNKSGESFYRCGYEFKKAWAQYEVDPATFTRLQAEQMIEVTGTEPADYEAPTPIKDDSAPFVDGPVKPEEVDALNVAINEAAAQLDKDNKEHFTADGVPKVEALAAILGYSVSAAERGAALAAAKAAAEGAE